jgi:acetyl-CoA carboxylase carboxyltransferase component
MTLKKEQAAAKGKEVSNEELDIIEQQISGKYEKEGSPWYSTSRLWDDGIIDPVETRDILALAIETARNAPIQKPKYGIFRM